VLQTIENMLKELDLFRSLDLFRHYSHDVCLHDSCCVLSVERGWCYCINFINTGDPLPAYVLQLFVCKLFM